MSELLGTVVDVVERDGAFVLTYSDGREVVIRGIIIRESKDDDDDCFGVPI